MYMNGQIVYDIDNKKPHKVGGGETSFAWSNLPKNSTHFIDLRMTKRDRLTTRDGRRMRKKPRSNIWVGAGATLDDAERMMNEGKIRPADREDKGFIYVQGQ